MSTENQVPEKLFLEDLEVRGKRVLVRVDFNVPMEKQGGRMVITDDRRIVESKPTIDYLCRQGARAILMSHLGRPKGKRAPDDSLKPVAERLAEILGRAVQLADDCIGDAVERQARALADGQVLLLENLRYHDAEEKNDPAFAARLARLGELYVNDAFGTAHRAHASTEGVTRHLSPCAAGYLLQKEIRFLDRALADPARPFAAIIGGAKISSKIAVLERLLDKVDALIIGGGMAYTFFKAMGREIGKSICENEQLSKALEIIAKAKKRPKVELLLPVDCVAAEKPDPAAKRQVAPAGVIPKDLQGLDIGPETIKLFAARVKSAKTVVWNGPMGVFEVPPFDQGTNAIAVALAEATAGGATTIIGGGDSALAIERAGLAGKVSHVSTGGGASLEFLEGKLLPGLAALTDK
jgi:phosphoglycerate kinase